MARTRKAKLGTRGPLQKVLDAERGPVIMIGPKGAKEAVYQDRRPLVSEHTKQHGQYEDHNRRVKNKAVTPVDKWISAGLVSDSQQAGILHCTKLWERVDSAPSLVANLDRTVFGCPGDGHPREIEARASIARLKARVGEGYWSVFENVVRFDEPAGVAGSRLENASRNRETAARHCVLFVADIVAIEERLCY